MAKRNVLDVAGSLMGYYDYLAANPNDDYGAHASEIGVKALSDFYQRHKVGLEHSFCQHQEGNRTGRSYGLHVSEVTGYEGWECDRSLFFKLMGEPKQATFSPALLRTFGVGTGMHFEMREILMPALELRYAGRLEFTHVEFEVSVGIDESYITGTPDAFIVFKDSTAKENRLVLDFKSTSNSQQEKRQARGRVTVEAEYERQLQTYLHRKDADYGIVVFWTKGWDHYFEQVVVPPRPRLYPMLEKRAQGVLVDIEAGRVSPPTRGTWCSRCAMQDKCADYDRRTQGDA